MSDSEDHKKMVSVLVKSADGSKAKSFIHHLTNSVSTISSDWAKECGVDPDSFQLQLNDKPVYDEMTLGTLEQSVPGMLEMTAENKIRISIEVDGDERTERKELLVGLSENPEHLQQSIAQLFDFEEKVRLRTTTRVLDYAENLKQNGVQEGSLVFVTAGFRSRKSQESGRESQPQLEETSMEESPTGEVKQEIKQEVKQEDDSSQMEVVDEAKPEKQNGGIESEKKDEECELPDCVALRQQVGSLQRRNQSLTAEVVDLEKRNRSLDSKVKKLTRANDSLTKKMRGQEGLGSPRGRGTRRRGQRLDEFTEQPQTSSEPKRRNVQGELNAVRVMLHSPKKRLSEDATIKLSRPEVTWNDIIPKIEFAFNFRIMAKTIAFQMGRLCCYGLESRRGLECWDPDSSQNYFISVEDGSQLDEESVTHHIHDFLRDNTPIRYCPGHIPVLHVYLFTLIMGLTSTDTPTVKEIGVPSLWDGRFLVLLNGLIFSNRRYKSKKLFIELANGDLCDSDTGDLFDTNELVLRSQGSAHRGSDLFHLILLLKHEDWLPSYALPDDMSVNAYTRHLADIEIEDGGVWLAEGQELPRDPEWTQTRNVSGFQKQLTTSMRC